VLSACSHKMQQSECLFWAKMNDADFTEAISGDDLQCLHHSLQLCSLSVGTLLYLLQTAVYLICECCVQAFWRALNSVFGDKIQFKTTLKGASMLMNSAFRDLWVPGLCFFLLFATMIAGLIELFTGILLPCSSCGRLSCICQSSLLRLLSC